MVLAHVHAIVNLDNIYTIYHRTVLGTKLLTYVSHDTQHDIA